MSSVRVKVNYLLWRLGLRAILPSAYVQRVAIVECDEPLQDIADTSILLDSRLGIDHFARESVVQALIHAQTLLPQGLKLLVVEAYRTRERQETLWTRAHREVRDSNPEISEDELDRLTNLVVGNPHRGRANGHQTGGAVDLTLADSSGELWMGTQVQEFAISTPTKATVSSEIRQRRKILVECMEKAGFENYPGEWWHFSLGDQLWAAYRRLSSAKFGEANESAARGI